MRVFLHILMSTCCCFGEIVLSGCSLAEAGSLSDNVNLKVGMQVCVWTKDKQIFGWQLLLLPCCWLLVGPFSSDAHVIEELQYGTFYSQSQIFHHSVVLTQNIFCCNWYKASSITTIHHLTSVPRSMSNQNRKLRSFLWHLSSQFLSLRLQKAVRIQPLCDISSPAQWNDMCHVVSLQSHPHFTLTNEGGCCWSLSGKEM